MTQDLDSEVELDALVDEQDAIQRRIDPEPLTDIDSAVWVHLSLRLDCKQERPAMWSYFFSAVSTDRKDANTMLALELTRAIWQPVGLFRDVALQHRLMRNVHRRFN